MPTTTSPYRNISIVSMCTVQWKPYVVCFAFITQFQWSHVNNLTAAFPSCKVLGLLLKSNLFPPPRGISHIYSPVLWSYTFSGCRLFWQKKDKSNLMLCLVSVSLVLTWCKFVFNLFVTLLKMMYVTKQEISTFLSKSLFSGLPRKWCIIFSSFLESKFFLGRGKFSWNVTVY